MAAICAPGGNSLRNSKARGSASPTAPRLKRNICRSDPVRAEAFKRDMTDTAADGRYYCLTPILIGAWKRVA
jgi:hypothetical protein